MPTISLFVVGSLSFFLCGLVAWIYLRWRFSRVSKGVESDESRKLRIRYKLEQAITLFIGFTIYMLWRHGDSYLDWIGIPSDFLSVYRDAVAIGGMYGWVAATFFAVKFNRDNKDQGAVD